MRSHLACERAQREKVRVCAYGEMLSVQHLLVCLGTLFRGPTLGLFSMAGRAANDRAVLKKKFH